MPTVCCWWFYRCCCCCCRFFMFFFLTSFLSNLYVHLWITVFYYKLALSNCLFRAYMFTPTTHILSSKSKSESELEKVRNESLLRLKMKFLSIELKTFFVFISGFSCFFSGWKWKQSRYGFMYIIDSDMKRS